MPAATLRPAPVKNVTFLNFFSFNPSISYTYVNGLTSSLISSYSNFLITSSSYFLALAYSAAAEMGAENLELLNYFLAFLSDGWSM